ncbi:hypothetical protein FPZ12_008000 [Amycolatopsis acidicola]|uniref:Type IV secretion system protein n=1 Tax=Amycolatopsis acidicola TaxID=2596893 RepID=A0A5N0VEV0_9PSEU|nr:hypothetical protein [Amycolatopsis acidicola]KAA9163964.1 hypothetical protein FPZ12_008000 [Amycolatopsis acidicola]
MNPGDWLKLFGQLGDLAGEEVKAQATGVFEGIMLGIWDAGLWILRTAFHLADQFSVFTVSTTEGPVSVLWPLVLWISGVLALGLFFWNMIVTVLRGGRGFARLVSGPFQYGVALSVTVGMTSAFLASADALTDAILDYGLHAHRFEDALNMTGLTDALSDSVKAVVLGLASIFGLVPAGIGYVIEMLFREAAIYILVATVPVTAAGLLARVSASWFWTCVRWLLAAIAMKPVLAFTIVLGVAIEGGAQGTSGLLVGVAVLLVSLIVPFVLFKLFAFVDPNSDAGATFRDTLQSAGADSYGKDSPSGKAASAGWKTATGGDDAFDDGQETANTDRFDTAGSDAYDEDGDDDWDDGGFDVGGADDTGDESPARPDNGHGEQEDPDPEPGDPADDTEAAPQPSEGEGSQPPLPEGGAPPEPPEEPGTDGTEGGEGPEVVE